MSKLDIVAVHNEWNPMQPSEASAAKEEAVSEKRDWIDVSEFGLPFPWRKYRVRLYDGSKHIAELRCGGEGYGAVWQLENGELQPIASDQVTHWQPVKSAPAPSSPAPADKEEKMAEQNRAHMCPSRNQYIPMDGAREDCEFCNPPASAPSTPAPDCAKCRCAKENHIPYANTEMKQKCLSCDDCDGYEPPAQPSTAESAAMTTSRMYYAQKDGCPKPKHEGTGKICYACVEEALANRAAYALHLQQQVEQLTDAYTKQVEHTNFVRDKYLQMLDATEATNRTLRKALQIWIDWWLMTVEDFDKEHPECKELSGEELAFLQRNALFTPPQTQKGEGKNAQ